MTVMGTTHNTQPVTTPAAPLDRNKYAELQGDILAARGKTDEAVARYLKAQQQALASGGNPAVLELKLERLGHTGDGA